MTLQCPGVGGRGRSPLIIHKYTYIHIPSVHLENHVLTIYTANVTSRFTTARCFVPATIHFASHVIRGGILESQPSCAKGGHQGLNLSACVVFTHRFPPKDTKNRRHHWQTTNHLDQLESVTNHHQQMKIPSGKQTVRYWTWPSRNSGYTHWKWWFSIVFCKRLPEGKANFLGTVTRIPSNHFVSWFCRPATPTALNPEEASRGPAMRSHVLVETSPVIPGYPWIDTAWWFSEGDSHDINDHVRNRFIGGTYHIFLAYFWGLCKGISPQNMVLYGTVPPF